ncbi:MAG: TraB/GumN family protein [Gammaproteobacteria bacterium]|nr:TraB/GumN family protein [Gammaproteobacteria bacterium]MDH5736188.1 TraB/GumN family protein [Gammaproteobacteria bacterium]
MFARLIKQFLIVVCFISTTSLSAAEQTADKERILHPKGLLWKIEKSGASPSFVFGTMHVSHQQVVTLAEPVERAFANADRFAMEVLLNFQAVGVITSRSFFNDGRTLKTLMQPDDFKKLSQLMQSKFSMTENMFMHMRPWMVFTMLMMPPEEMGKDNSALDMVLYRRAAMRKIPLLGLETADEQLDVLEAGSIDDQIWMLNKTVEEYDQISQQFSEMVTAYIDRDLAKLVIMQEQSMYDDSEIDDRFLEQLIDMRNARMVERMQSYLQTGNAFIAIGALHLPGEKGVLHLLELQGYSVSSVY